MMNYDGYKWIKVKHHKFDPAKTWEENYRDLEKHHIEETTFLIDEVRGLAKDTFRWRTFIANANPQVIGDTERSVVFQVEAGVDWTAKDLTEAVDKKGEAGKQ